MNDLGNSLAFMLSSGRDYDAVHAVPLLQKVYIEGSSILGVKAYGAKAIRAHCLAGGYLYEVMSTIPGRQIGILIKNGT